MKKASAYLAFAFLLASCATYQAQVDQARRLVSSGQYTAAAERLKLLADKPGKDRLVHVLDYALTEQIAGRYEQSNKYFLLADTLADRNDYHSVSKVVSSIFVNEEMIQYKGDDFENLLINTMLAVNFSVLGDFESARVETKKSSEKINKYQADGKKHNTLNPFVIYLNAIIWEANKDWDDAYIDYKKVYELSPGFSFVKKDLIRIARLSRRYNELKKWKKEFGLKEEKSKAKSEVILIYQQGWGPRKQPGYSDPIVPQLVPVSSYFTGGAIEVNGGSKIYSQVVFDVGRAAIASLNRQMAPLVAKRLAAIAAKKVLSHQLSKKDQGLGFLADIAMSVAERADLRQWSLLPSTFQVARTQVAPGEHNVTVYGTRGESEQVICRFEKLIVKPNEKKIINCRGF